MGNVNIFRLASSSLIGIYAKKKPSLEVKLINQSDIDHMFNCSPYLNLNLNLNINGVDIK